MNNFKYVCILKIKKLVKFIFGLIINELLNKNIVS